MAMQYQDRPWITVKDAHPTLIEADKQINGVIAVTNSGKSPAFDTTSDATMFVTTNESLDVDPLTGHPEYDVTHDLVTPNVDAIISVHSKGKPTAVEVERLKQPDTRFYFYGNITYRDNVSIHHTQFCYFTFPGLNGMRSCVGKRYKNTAD